MSTDDQKPEPPRPPVDRGDMIRRAMALLAGDPTAAGATIIMPSGETITLNGDHARALYGRKPSGRAS